MNNNFLVPLPVPKANEVLQKTRLALEDWYTAFVRKENFKMPKGMNSIDFRIELLDLRLKLSNPDASSHLAKAQEFVAKLDKANPKRARK